MSQELRDSWEVWRAKVDGDLKTYDPVVIEGIIEHLNELHTYVAGILKDLVVIKNAIASLTEQQQINTNDIASLKERVDTNETNISALQDTVATLRRDVDTNTGDITSINNELDDVADVLNGIYPLMALGDITMYENVKSILDNIPEP